MSTLSEVAKRAGISKTTASRVLNNRPSGIPISEETRKKVLKAAKELNYYPNIFARSLRTKKSGIVGVVVSDITDPYFSDIISGIEQVLNKSGYYFLLSTVQNSPEKEEAYLARLRRSGVDGLLIVGATMQLRDKEIKKLENSEIPVVLVGRKLSHSSISSVTVDNFTGGFLATEHLIKLGHQYIVHITTKEARVDGRERLNGYTAAMKKYGLEDKCYIAKGGITAESGYEITLKVLKDLKSTTAIFAFNDMTAIGSIRAIRDSGLHVPEDISVVGFDGIPIAAHYEPPLTTVHQPRMEMGRLGAELLIKAMDEKGGSKRRNNVILKPKLTIRKSSRGVILRREKLNRGPGEVRDIRK